MGTGPAVRACGRCLHIYKRALHVDSLCFPLGEGRRERLVVSVRSPGDKAFARLLAAPSPHCDVVWCGLVVRACWQVSRRCSL